MLKITAATRANPAPCDHWAVTVHNEVTDESVTLPPMARADLEAQTFVDQRWWVRVALLWVRAQLNQGATPASLLNAEILTVATMTALLQAG